MFFKRSASVDPGHDLYADLKAAHERETRAWRAVVDVLAEQVEFLRTQIPGRAHYSQTVSRAAGADVSMEMGTPLHLTEEEEELLALRVNERITQDELRQLQDELGLDITDALHDE